MLRPWIVPTVALGSVVLWAAGLRLFLDSQLSRTRKLGWVAFLLFVGIGSGLLLPSGQIWTRFLVLLLAVPLLALADVWLFRSGRSPSFWVRACGFEICTVFGTAACARYLLDLFGVAAYVCHT